MLWSLLFRAKSDSLQSADATMQQGSVPPPLGASNYAAGCVDQGVPNLGHPAKVMIFELIHFWGLFGGLNFAPNSEVLIWAEICTFFATAVWIFVFASWNSRENGQFLLEKLPFLEKLKNWPFSLEFRETKSINVHHISEAFNFTASTLP